MILGVVDHDRGTLNPLSLQMLTFGRRLAAQLNVPLHALLIGAGSQPVAAGLAGYGISTLHLATHDRLDEYAPAAWARCVAEAMNRTAPQIVLAAGSERGHEVMAHVAAQTDLPLAANCTEVRPGEPFAVTRQRWGGSLLEDAALHGDVSRGRALSCPLLTVAPHAVPAEEAPDAAEPQVDLFAPTLSESDLQVRVVSRVEPERGKISLADARVVVGGGRGIGSAEGFQVLQEVADLLGGAIGCSRAVTSLGWRPHADQVGQTGTRIAPEVYIACGISGAIQHMVGCKSARCIVAINKDPDAPIMARADYAIIGDVRQALPALRDALARARTHP